MPPDYVCSRDCPPDRWAARKADAPPQLLHLAEQGRQMLAGDRARWREREAARLSAARAALERGVAAALHDAEWLAAYRQPDGETFAAETRQWQVVFDLSPVGWQPVILRLWRRTEADTEWATFTQPWAVPGVEGVLTFGTLAEALAQGADVIGTPF